MGFACMSADLHLLGWVKLELLAYLYKAFSRCDALQSLLRSKIFHICIQDFWDSNEGWLKGQRENRQSIATSAPQGKEPCLQQSRMIWPLRLMRQICRAFLVMKSVMSVTTTLTAGRMYLTGTLGALTDQSGCPCSICHLSRDVATV